MKEQEQEQSDGSNKLLYLDSGEVIITKLLFDKNNENVLCLLKPFVIKHNEENTIFSNWIPEAKGDIFLIPINKILTITEPKLMFSEIYNKIISGVPDSINNNKKEDDNSKSNFIPTNDEGVTIH
jgi:hypothetical protein